MVIKIPVYVECDRRLSPDQVKELTLSLQYLLTKDLLQIQDGILEWRIFGETKYTKFKVLSQNEVMSKITGVQK